MTLPKNKPVIPPFTKVTIKAKANSIGIVRLIFAFHSVMTQLYTLRAVGTAIIKVVVAKKKPNQGFIPATYI